MFGKDQPGKDDDSKKSSSKIPFQVLRQGKIIISVTDHDHETHHVVTPIPNSYEAAMALAFDHLSEHLAPKSRGPSSERPVLQAFHFKYWARTPSGEAIWAKLPAEFWEHIVHDGDHLKLCTEEGGLSDEISNPGQIELSLFEKGKGVGSSSKIDRPKSLAEAKKVAYKTFLSGSTRTIKRIHLRLSRNDWRPVKTEDDWKDMIADAEAIGLEED